RWAMSSPTGVSITRRGARSTSATPSSSSSLRIWVDRVGWLTKHAAAARPKCRWSARATRYLRSRRFMAWSAGPRPARTGRGEGSGGLLLLGRGGADQVVERAQRGGRSGAHRDHDLLVRHRGRVAGGEHARDRGRTALVDHDLAARAQLHRALQPLGVGQQADLDEDAGEFDRLRLAGAAVPVDQSGDPLAVAEHLGGLRVEQDVDVAEAAELALQHLVGTHAGVELDQGDVLADAGQVEGARTSV